MKRNQRGWSTIGIEEQSLLVYLWEQAGATFEDRATRRGIDGWFDGLRTAKTKEELEKLRASFHLTDRGHSAARQVDLSGKSDIEAWGEVQADVNSAAGERVQLGNNCVVGRRAENGGGFPGAEKIQPGDALILDLSARLNGYWSASTATYYAGEPDETQKAAHRPLQPRPA